MVFRLIKRFSCDDASMKSIRHKRPDVPEEPFMPVVILVNGISSVACIFAFKDSVYVPFLRKLDISSIACHHDERAKLIRES